MKETVIKRYVQFPLRPSLARLAQNMKRCAKEVAVPNPSPPIMRNASARKRGTPTTEIASPSSRPLSFAWHLINSRLSRLRNSTGCLCISGRPRQRAADGSAVEVMVDYDVSERSYDEEIGQARRDANGNKLFKNIFP